jgi:hypothetical protein
MLMRKPTDDLPAIKKKPEYMEQSSSSESDSEEGTGSDAEMAAKEFMDAVKSGDAKALVDAFMALDMACDSMEMEPEEGEDREGDKASPKDLISVILAKKKA